ncbi:hypothetical protein ACS0PU_008719 [Formica fusca]
MHADSCPPRERSNGRRVRHPDLDDAEITPNLTPNQNVFSPRPERNGAASGAAFVVEGYEGEAERGFTVRRSC